MLGTDIMPCFIMNVCSIGVPNTLNTYFIELQTCGVQYCNTLLYDIEQYKTYILTLYEAVRHTLWCVRRLHSNPTHVHNVHMCGHSYFHLLYNFFFLPVSLSRGMCSVVALYVYNLINSELGLNL
uniref:Uncharacterized protein n=1 Tax=Cacopsylla melanoneura TaxID=428564 RepID=A0A8D8ZC08_9HEMI